MVVHLWGHPADMDAICAVAARHGLAVIEDAAHAHGGLYKGRRTGTIGDIGCFSFQNTKAIPAGEGGMMVTNRREYFERALLLTQSPTRLKMHIQMAEHQRFRDTGFGGFKFRINPLNAAMGVVQMKRFEEYNRIREDNLHFLTGMLRDIPGIEPPYTSPDVTRGGYYGYRIVFKAEEVEDLPIGMFVAAMNAEGVPLAPERYPMLHLTAMFREKNPLGRGWPWSYSDAGRAVQYAAGDLPVTEYLYPRMLGLEGHDKAVPCHDLFEQYAAAFRKVVHHAGRLKSAAAVGA
jgi:dTDP-4-amino-4,6-dideoxygalactose transaminase